MARFNIRKDGVIQGGNASYFYDALLRQLTYSATVKVKIGFITKTQSFQGAVPVNEADIAWGNFDEPGEQKRVGDALITVIAVAPDSSQVNFKFLGSSVEGNGLLVRNGGLAYMQYGAIRASAFGLSLNLTLDPA